MLQVMPRSSEWTSITDFDRIGRKIVREGIQ